MLPTFINTMSVRTVRMPFGPASFGIHLRLDAVHAGLYLLLALVGLYLIQRSFSDSLVVFSLSEIDVVIPTPVPRWKFMALKLAKMYVRFGLLLALMTFFMLPGVAMFVGNWSAQYTPVTWLALVLYAALIINVCTIINLMVQYASPKSGVWPRILVRAAAYVLLVLAAVFFYEGYARTGAVIEGLGALLRNPLFVALMLPAAWASNLAMSPAIGWSPALGAQLALLVGLVGASYVLVLRRRENPYEPSLSISVQAAAMRAAMRSGGVSRLPADMWKKRTAGMNKITLRPFGREGTAVLWKNLAVSLRMWRSGLISAAIIIPCGMLVLRLVITDPETRAMAPKFMAGGLLYFVFIVSQIMLQTLRRDLKQGDMLKPMPIPAWQVMAAHTGHAGIVLAALIWLTAGSALVVGGFPPDQIFVYAALGLPFVAYSLVCSQLITAILYPNMQDLSQTYIGGLLGMMLSGIAIGPPVGIGILFWYLKLPVWLGVPIMILVSLAIAVAGIAAGAAVYRRHDPTDE
jgi:hypothetical protein